MERGARKEGDVYGGRKERRRKSLDGGTVGDELNVFPTDSAALNEVLHEGERILCSGTVQKLNQRNKLQERLLVATTRGVVNLQPGVFKVLRFIAYEAIASIAVSPYADEIFVIRVPYEQRGDYVLMSSRKTEFVSTIANEVRRITEKPLEIFVGDHIPYRLCTGLLRTMVFTIDSMGSTPARGGSFVRPKGKREVAIIVAGADGNTSEGEEDEQKRSSVVLGVVNQGGAMVVAVQDDGDFAQKQQISSTLATQAAAERVKLWQQRPAGATPSATPGASAGTSTPPPKLEKKPPPKCPPRPSKPSVPSIRFPRVRVMYNYEGQGPEELSVYADDILLVIEQTEDGWWLGVDPEGNEGLFPSNYTQLLA